MYSFQVFRLIVFILSLSYFVGAIWFICTKHFTDLDQLAKFRAQEATLRYLQDETEEAPEVTPTLISEVDLDDPVDKPFTFYAQFDLDQNENETNLILVMYFAFTTLSTVGFGDYHPKSEIERVINTFILLVGVTAFSYIMGQFIEILIDLRTVTASNENSQQLAEWFGMLAHFNKNRPLPKNLIGELETYFDYFWKNDRNYAIKSEEDQRFMDELPNNIQTDIYKDFLFQDFLQLFKVHFQFTKPQSNNQKDPFDFDFYHWRDASYSTFMIALLQGLEPRFYTDKEIILQEGDEVNEEIFVINKDENDKGGKYCIGFEDRTSQQRYFHIKLGFKTIIGSYEILMDQKSQFVYKALSHIDAYGLRKESLQPILEEHPEFRSQMTQYTIQYYYKIIKIPMIKFKKSIYEQVRKAHEMEKCMREVTDELKSAEKRYEIEQSIKFDEEDDSDAVKNEEIDKKVNTLVDSVKELSQMLESIDHFNKWKSETKSKLERLPKSRDKKHLWFERDLQEDEKSLENGGKKERKPLQFLRALVS